MATSFQVWSLFFVWNKSVLVSWIPFQTQNIHRSGVKGLGGHPSKQILFQLATSTNKTLIMTILKFPRNCCACLFSAILQHDPSDFSFEPKTLLEWHCSNEHLHEQFGTTQQNHGFQNKRGQKYHPNFATNITMEFHYHIFCC